MAYDIEILLLFNIRYINRDGSLKFARTKPHFVVTGWKLDGDVGTMFEFIDNIQV